MTRISGALGPVTLALLAASSVAAGELSVSESGVGEAVVERELRGSGEQFPEGGEVWFWTRVEGGAQGQRIRHVWIHEGRELASVDLSVDGTPWRTFSKKKLYPGSAGSWSVEARDETGRVLARAQFTCTPPGPAAGVGSAGTPGTTPEANPQADPDDDAGPGS